MIPALIDFLVTYHQRGDADGVANVAQTLLQVIPDDLVALQFLALALLWLGHKDRALVLFQKAAVIAARVPEIPSLICKRASSITLAESLRPELAGGWQQIASALEQNGVRDLAQQAKTNAHLSRQSKLPG